MGWNGSGGASTPVKPEVAAKKPSPIRGIIAGLVIVLAAVAYFVFFSGTEKPQKVEAQKKPTAIKEVKPAPGQTVSRTNFAQKVEEELPSSKRRVKTLSVTTNTTGRVYERYMTADGKTHLWIHDSRPPVFKHMTDQILVMALGIDDRRSMPPLPPMKNLDRQFVEAMKEPIVIDPDDPPKVVDMKKRVQKARAQVDELMKQGIGFSQIIADHEKLMGENKKIRDEMVAEIKRANAEGDVESTKKALDRINDTLKSMGITEIEMPLTAEESMARRAAAREAARENVNVKE